MEILYRKSQLALKKLQNIKYHRYLFNELLGLDYRLIGIRGARGVGKTILMLQLLQQLHLPPEQAIYVSLDDPIFMKTRFVDFIDWFYKFGGKFVFADEVHKYRNWSRELKNVYDFYTDIKIIFSASSVLDLFKAEADLARRAVMFDLNELSLREFALIKYDLRLPVLKLEEILQFHSRIASDLLMTDFKPIKLLKEYFVYGAYPLFSENIEFYTEQLTKTIDLIIETDLPSVERIEYQTVYKLRKLLKVIAESSPFKPNIAKLSNELNTSRDRLLKFLHLLERAKLIRNIRTKSQGIAYLRKPEKILLNNPNLLYAYSDTEPNKGSLRETFFVSQITAKHQVTYPETGDFLIDGRWLFEIGGKSKTQKQIAGQPDAFIAADDIEIGFGNKIPLWLLGFLY